jgi:type IV pilus assembly protein PilW
VSRRGLASQGGFSLVELMVAMTLGLALSWLVLDVYITSSQAQQRLLRNQEVQESGRYLSELLRRELGSAGFYGFSGSQPPPAGLPAAPCQLLDSSEVNQQLSYPLMGINNAVGALTCRDQRAAASAKDLSSCDAQQPLSLDLRTGSDLIGLRRAAYQPALGGATGARKINSSLESCEYYLASAPSGPVVAKFVKGDGSNRSLTGGAVWRYLEDIFYITAAGEFRRVYLDEGRFKSSRTIAEGVEDLQFEYGIDVNGDGAVDEWRPVPIGAAEWAGVVAVNYYLLMVGSSVLDDEPVKSFHYAGEERTAPDDGRLRQLFTGSVRVASPAMRRGGQ